MAKKKELKPFDYFYDLMVKMNNVYKDVYIINHKYCIAGKETDEDALGDILLTLEDKYVEALNSLHLPDNIEITNIREFKSSIKDLEDDYDILMDIIDKLVKANKIPDDKLENLAYMKESSAPMEDFYMFLGLSDDFINAIKEEISSKNRENVIRNLIHVIKDKEILDKCNGRIELLNNEFSKDIIWDNLGDNEELIKTIYRDKRIFNMKIPNKDSYITIAKQLFPLVTEKNIKSAFMNLEKDEEFDDLYILRIDFSFSHFRFWAIYHSVPTRY